MFNYLKRHCTFLFGLLFVLSVTPFLLQFAENTLLTSVKGELYNPNLSRLNSIDKVLAYTDSSYAVLQLSNLDTAKYVSIVSGTIKERFFFSLSNYGVCDNWIAYFCGKIFWSHFSGIVKPDDILKYQHGLCSQQTIVFMEILKRKGIRHRSIGLGYTEGPGHFLSEVNYAGTWHLYDVTMEPVWKNIVNHHQGIDYYLNNKDSLFLAYREKYSKATFDKLLEQVVYGETNVFPAKNMLLFHNITLFLTYAFPFFFLFLFLRAFKKEIVLKKRLVLKKQLDVALFDNFEETVVNEHL